MNIANSIGKICPYCNTVIQTNEEVAVCPSCGAVHRKGCWQKNDGCTSSVCPEQLKKPAVPESTVFCANCGTELRADFICCKKCGAPRPESDERVCSVCGTSYQPGQQFCEHCGHKLGQPVPVQFLLHSPNPMPPKSNSKMKTLAIVLPIVIAVVLIASIVAGVVIYPEIQKKKKHEYIVSADAFLVAVLECSINLEEVGDEIETAWTAYIAFRPYNGTYYDSFGDLIEAALITMSDEINEVESYDTALENCYSYLMELPDPDDKQLIVIRGCVKELYADYQDFYDCVTNPSGSYNTWIPEFKASDSAVTDSSGEFVMLMESMDMDLGDLGITDIDLREMEFDN